MYEHFVSMRNFHFDDEQDNHYLSSKSSWGEWTKFGFANHLNLIVRLGSYEKWVKEKSIWKTRTYLRLREFKTLKGECFVELMSIFNHN